MASIVGHTGVTGQASFASDATRRRPEVHVTPGEGPGADLTEVKLSVLKNDRAKAIRFSTLTAICDALDCQPGDVLRCAPRKD
jgi:hypothetical protein